MKTLLLFILLSTAAWGQLPTSVWNGKQGIPELGNPLLDTIPVSLLVRISGKPWAFFHDGWEVRKVDSAEMKKSVFANAHGYVPSIYVVETVPIYSHLLYLDSKKRPIRKEWVVYQTFKR